ncbi:MAG: iron-sulfur cluster-binding oxidoreductase [Paenibacillaceae bacterium]|jgi:hypothetical protein|nr:iron-sulfur cluster-binding oxidoreductase [Paenibacillaceae bacterium]
MLNPVNASARPTDMNQIPKWNEEHSHIVDYASAQAALADYLLQANYQGYRPDRRKVLAVRRGDRTVTLRNAGTPLRQEVYYLVEGELFPVEGTTRLSEGQTPVELAGELLGELYSQLCIWVAYDFTKGSLAGFRKSFDNPLIVEGSPYPNPLSVTRNRDIKEGINPQFFQPDPVPKYVPQEAFRPDLSLEEINEFIAEVVRKDFRNTLPEGSNPPIWDEPLVGIASAHDPLFKRFQDPEVVGPGHRLPEEWLPGAQSIISFFLPYSKEILFSYKKESRYSSLEYASGKWNGSKFLNVVRRALIRFVREQGGEGVAPNIDPRYDSDGMLPFWSERHTAFAAGVGTFGLHQGLITVKGVYGRLGSVITTLRLTPTERSYTDVYEYCLYAHDGSCYACIDRCPSRAITDAGKLPGMCTKHGNGEHFKEWEYGSCGHCSTFVPCSRRIPVRSKA